MGNFGHLTAILGSRRCRWGRVAWCDSPTRNPSAGADPLNGPAGAKVRQAETMVYRERNLTKEALDLFLERLDPNPERAGQEYLKLRCRLVSMLRSLRCALAEDLADEVIFRVVEKLGQIPIGNFVAFVRGVAKNVALEESRKPKSVPIPWDSPSLQPFQTDTDKEEKEMALACLEEYLGRLPRRDRELILEYYQYEHRARIDARKRLAKRLGISEGDLRIRAHRIRKELKRHFIEGMKRIRDSVT